MNQHSTMLTTSLNMWRM